MMKTLTKWLKVVLAVLVVGFVLIFAYGVIRLGAGTTWRMLRWGDSDVRDYQKFPARELAAG